LGSSLEIACLSQSYAARTVEPESVLADVYGRIEKSLSRNVWIERVPFQDAQRALASAALRVKKGENLPLFAIPFAVKDNIDVEGLPTTAGCPEFRYLPEKSAPVVERLVAAGAVLVGKTNLDQFATGLVGTRSPYGACSSAFNEDYICGGSSSGSALAVALGLVSFALGTDTAGSGRVPAAFNNVVGYKPTRGVLSTAGVVPACRSLDCVSVFAASASDAERVLAVAELDRASGPARKRFKKHFRFGVPQAEQLEFFGDRAAQELYERALERLRALGGEPVRFDFVPFRATGELLYGGPWVAERLAALGAFFERRPNAVEPVVYRTISAAKKLSAVDAFNGMYRLRELEQLTAASWSVFDVMLLPTTGTIYTIEQVRAEPVTLNANLGYYTNFVNLLDLAAVAVPFGFRENGTPFGVSLIGPRNDDRALLALADALHRSQSPEIGATGVRISDLGALAAAPVDDSAVELAVVGAHLSGQPLNHELVNRGGRLVRTCRSSPDYRLYALSGTVPPKPGLLREPGFSGPGIEVEVWELGVEAFGSFVAGVPPPLGIGTITLDDGSKVHGFVCEAYAIGTAREITEFGGWRAYLAAKVG
jgi:allophanate hydrolase